MDAKVYLTTFIAGRAYQEYIPLLLFSLKRAYPEYRTILFIHGKLDDRIRRTVRDFGLDDNARLVENAFDDCPKINTMKAKALRWVLWDDEFEQADFLYTVDTDIFYLREPVPLAEQHVRHMAFCGLPFSNIVRVHESKPYRPGRFLRHAKYAGFADLPKFWLHPFAVEYRLSGLHFVDRAKYYEKITPEIRRKEKEAIYSGHFLKEQFYTSDEIFLYRMVKNSGFDITRLGIQTDPVTMLSPDCPERAQFRPHHGIHLGIFRSPCKTISRQPAQMQILRSSAYRYYFERFSGIARTEEWQRFIACLPPAVCELLARLDEMMQTISKEKKTE